MDDFKKIAQETRKGLEQFFCSSAPPAKISCESNSLNPKSFFQKKQPAKKWKEKVNIIGLCNLFLIFIRANTNSSVLVHISKYF